jgi:HK97 family phage major capsid protein
MRFTNVAQATAAGVELARRLHAMLEEGNDGSGGVDLLRVSALNGDATQRQEEFDRLSAELQEIWDERTRLETMQATFERTRQIVDDGTTPRNRPAQPRGRERDHRSAGQRFTEDEGWQSYLASISAGGDVRRQTVIAGPRVSLPGPLASRSIRNAVMVEGDPDSGGAFLVPQETGIIVPLPGRETTLLDLVTVGDAISGESVRAVRMTSKNASTETPDPANAASGVKPELDMNFEPVTWNVANIAGMVTASTRSLADVGVLRTLIDRFLRESVTEEAERQVLEGTGTGEEMEGIDTVHTLDQAYSDDVTDLDPLLQTTRKALTQLQLARGLRPNGYVFHPTDWEQIDLARMVKNPNNEAAGPGTRMLHGYPVVLNELIDEGTAWVGDWRWYVIWPRESFSVAVSNSHKDYFQRNLVAILGEERAAGGLLRTDAVVKIDLTA